MEMAEFSLWNYNKNPGLFEEVQRLGIYTFANVYQEWSASKYRNISRNAINGYKTSFAKCEAIWDMKIAELKNYHFQRIMNSSDLKLKSLMVIVFEYAVQNDIMNKNYEKYVILNKKEEPLKIHKPFTEKEIEIIFEHDNIPFVDTILIMIYTGFHVGELFSIKMSDVDLQSMTIRGGLKTEAGKNRMVPVHEKIQQCILKYTCTKHEYLFCDFETGKPINYHSYRNIYFDKIMEMFHMEHLPHDCRHTFAIRLSKYRANTTSIRKLIGHTSYRTTEKIYTLKIFRSYESQYKH